MTKREIGRNILNLAFINFKYNQMERAVNCKAGYTVLCHRNMKMVRI